MTRLLAHHDRSNALVYSDLEFLCEALQSRSRLPEIAALARAFGVAGLVLAAAQPMREVRAALPLPGLIFCIDTSGSMTAHDYRPTRSAAVRAAVRTFMLTHPQRRVQLVAFAGAARVISGADAIPAPNGQTAIGSALQMALSLAARGSQRVVLMTDGVSNTGPEPSIVINALRAAHIPVHAILLGEDASIARTVRAYAGTTGGTFAQPHDTRGIIVALERAAAVRDFHAVRRGMTVVFAAAALCILLAGALGPVAAGYFARESEPDGDAPLRYRDDAPYV